MGQVVKPLNSVPYQNKCCRKNQKCIYNNINLFLKCIKQFITLDKTLHSFLCIYTPIRRGGKASSVYANSHNYLISSPSKNLGICENRLIVLKSYEQNNGKIL